MKHSELKEMIRRVVKERALTGAEERKKEQIVKGMKKFFKGDESDMYAIATDRAKKLKEGEDHEVSMAISSLEAIAESIIELRQKLGTQERNIPGWIQDHIAKAENYIEQAAQGFHELHEEKDPLDFVVSEKKGKDQDGDGDIDSKDWQIGRDIAIKAQMAKKK
jgi:predicted  nucleic acid-binding Zn-ribbon protein